MDYLARHHALRIDPRQLLPGARSIIVVADLYRPPQEDATRRDAANAGPTGRIARYAWGRDYHRALRKKLHHLADRLHEMLPEPFESRVCIDTAPIVEREWAAVAGVGWIGKNTMVLDEAIGSFFFLGEIITSLELAPTPPATDRCGTCTRCLDACPTHALVAPYRMDARRCISYLTIEHRGDIEPGLQPLMGDWLYGCDICQDVCPHNRRRTTPMDVPPMTCPPVQVPALDPAYDLNDRNPLPPRASLLVLQQWTDADYARHLAGSAMKRATLAMLKRNAAIAARNQAADSSPRA
jgi:epoxyqueuosine reductase